MIKENKKMLFLAVVLNAILSPLSALAAAVPVPFANNIPSNIPTDLTVVIGSIVSGVVSLMALVAVLFLVSGGVQYLTSGGEEAQVEKAKNTMTYALLGLVIAAVSYAAIVMIVGWLK